jgi:hypothetical protein
MRSDTRRTREIVKFKNQVPSVWPASGSTHVDIFGHKDIRSVQVEQLPHAIQGAAISVATNVSESPIDEAISAFENHKAKPAGVGIYRENTSRTMRASHRFGRGS